MRESSSNRAPLAPFGARGVHVAVAIVLLAQALASGAAAARARLSLRWEAIADATSYQIQIAPDPQFAAPLVDRRLATPSFAWDDLPAEQCFWRVRSIDGDGRPGRWSAVSIIAPIFVPPSVIAPKADAAFAAAATPPDIELRYEPVPNAVEYEVEVSTDPKLQARTVVLRVRETSATYVSASVGVHYWRVRAIDERGRSTSFCEPASFRVTLAAPVLIEPGPDAVLTYGQSTTLRWSPRPQATAFSVLLSRDLRGEDVVASVETSEDRVLWPATTSGKLYWRVVARAAASQASASLTGRFRVGPGAPELIELGDASAPPRVLSWRVASGAARYHLEITTEKDAAPLVLRWSGEQTTYRIEAIPPGTYLWRVTSEAATGERSPSSALGRFHVPPLSPVPSPPPVTAAVGPKPLEPSPATHTEPLVSYLAPYLALASNRGAMTTLRLGAEAGYRPGALGSRLGLAVRAGYLTATASAAAAVGSSAVRARLHAVPFDFIGVALFRRALATLVVGAGASVIASVVSIEVPSRPPASELGVDFGLLGQLGVERVLGPGMAFAQVTYVLSTKASGRVSRDLGGAAVEGGYRFWVW